MTSPTKHTHTVEADISPKRQIAERLERSDEEITCSNGSSVSLRGLTVMHPQHKNQTFKCGQWVQGLYLAF